MTSLTPDRELSPPALHQSGDGDAGNVFPSRRFLHWSGGVLLAYFGMRLLYLAVSIGPGIPPDEISHFGICDIFSRYLLLPENTPDSYRFGLVTNIPWLYYWIMGKLLALNFFGISDLVYLRLLNIPLAFGHVYYVWRMLRLLTDDRLTQILLLAAVTNTMMLTFLSAFVSYDNLTNLLAAMAIYHLLAFFTGRSGSSLALSLLCQLAGCLTKMTFLPLVLALNALLLIHEFRNLTGLPRGLSAWFRASGRQAAFLAGLLLMGVALNFQLYGGNYLRYGSITLETTQVLPLDDALQYRLAARGYVFNLFRDGKLSREEALAMTSRIDHPGDRADARFMIENYAKFRSGEIPVMTLPEYIPVWTRRMAAGIFGIFAHLQMASYWPTIAPIALLGAVTLIAFLLRWRPRDSGGIPTMLLAVAGSYTVFILYRFNYQNYLDNGAPFIALQGRYLFPVIGSIYVLSSLYLMRLCQGKAARIGIWGAAVCIFVMSDFPLFLARVTPQWSYWPPS